METEGSITHSQEYATCPPIYVSVFQVVSFPQVSPLKLCMDLSSPLRASCPAHLSLFYMVTRVTFGEELSIKFLVM
jgi:hypothetical protein